MEKEGDRRAIVFIHGLLGNYNDWNQMISLCNETYLIYNHQLLGHAGVEYTGNVMSDDISKITLFIFENNVTNLIIIAHSIGGLIALEVAKGLLIDCSVILINVATRQPQEKRSEFVIAQMQKYPSEFIKRHYLKMFGKKSVFHEAYKKLAISEAAYMNYMKVVISYNYSDLSQYTKNENIYAVICDKVFGSWRSIKSIKKYYGYNNLSQEHFLCIHSKNSFIMKEAPGKIMQFVEKIWKG